MVRFTVCIATVRPDTLGATVHSIQRQRYAEWDLLLVGQGESRELRRVCEGFARSDARIRYLHLDEMGLSRARNAGINAATGEIIAFTDDDCEADPDWLFELAAVFRKYPAAALVGGSVIAPPPPKALFATCPAIEPLELVYDPIASGRRPPKGFGWIGANFAISSAAAAQIGSFDAHLGAGTSLPAGEDVDYLLRIEHAGLLMCATPKAIVYHTHGYRRGFKAVLRGSRNYAVGNGGLAGKLDMLEDPRGQEWLAITARASTIDVLRKFHIHRLPFSLLRLLHYRQGYKKCLREFRADPVRRLLTPRGSENVVLPVHTEVPSGDA